MVKRKLQDTDEYYRNLLGAFESEGDELDKNMDDDSKDTKELDQNFGTTNHQAPDIDNNEGTEAIKEGDTYDSDLNFQDKSRGTISNNFEDESGTVITDDYKFGNSPDMTGTEAEDTHVHNNKFDTNFEDHSEKNDEIDPNWTNTKEIADEGDMEYQMPNQEGLYGDLGDDAEPALDQMTPQPKKAGASLYSDLGTDAEPAFDNMFGKKGGGEEEDDPFPLEAQPQDKIQVGGLFNNPEEPVIDEANGTADPLMLGENYAKEELELCTCGHLGGATDPAQNKHEDRMQQGHGACTVCPCEQFTWTSMDRSGEAEGTQADDGKTIDGNFDDESDGKIDDNFENDKNIADETDLADNKYGSNKSEGTYNANKDTTGLTQKKADELYDASSDPSHGVSFKCNCGTIISESAYESHLETAHAGDPWYNATEFHDVPIENDDIKNPDEDEVTSQDDSYNSDPQHEIGSHMVQSAKGQLSNQTGAKESFKKKRHAREDIISCPVCGNLSQDGDIIADHLEDDVNGHGWSPQQLERWESGMGVTGPEEDGEAQSGEDYRVMDDLVSFGSDHANLADAIKAADDAGGYVVDSDADDLMPEISHDTPTYQSPDYRDEFPNEDVVDGEWQPDKPDYVNEPDYDPDWVNHYGEGPHHQGKKGEAGEGALKDKITGAWNRMDQAVKEETANTAGADPNIATLSLSEIEDNHPEDFEKLKMFGVFEDSKWVGNEGAGPCEKCGNPHDTDVHDEMQSYKKGAYGEEGLYDSIDSTGRTLEEPSYDIQDTVNYDLEGSEEEDKNPNDPRQPAIGGYDPELDSDDPNDEYSKEEEFDEEDMKEINKSLEPVPDYSDPEQEGMHDEDINYQNNDRPQPLPWQEGGEQGYDEGGMQDITDLEDGYDIEEEKGNDYLQIDNDAGFDWQQGGEQGQTVPDDTINFFEDSGDAEGMVQNLRDQGYTEEEINDALQRGGTDPSYQQGETQTDMYDAHRDDYGKDEGLYGSDDAEDEQFSAAGVQPYGDPEDDYDKWVTYANKHNPAEYEDTLYDVISDDPTHDEPTSTESDGTEDVIEDEGIDPNAERHEDWGGELPQVKDKSTEQFEAQVCPLCGKTFKFNVGNQEDVSGSETEMGDHMKMEHNADPQAWAEQQQISFFDGELGMSTPVPEEMEQPQGDQIPPQPSMEGDVGLPTPETVLAPEASYASSITPRSNQEDDDGKKESKDLLDEEKPKSAEATIASATSEFDILH